MMSRPDRRFWLPQLLVTIALAQIAAGCLTVSDAPRSSAGAPPDARIWPDSPEPARIQYMGSITGGHDLGREESVFGRLGAWIFGISDDKLVRPTGVAVQGNLIAVADPGRQALFLFDRKAGSAHVITSVPGQELVSPVSVCIAASGDVYVVDSFLRRIFVFGPDARLRREMRSDELRRPSSVAFDEGPGRLYVADVVADAVHVFSAEGALLFTFGERGAGAGQFNGPSHLWVDGNGTVYVVDALNFRLQLFDRDGHFLSRLGQHGDSSGDFARPKGVAVDSEGHIYVVDALFGAVQIFRANGDLLLSFGGNGEGPGQFWLPVGIAIDSTDHVYVADSYNRRLQVFQYLGAAYHGATDEPN